VQHSHVLASAFLLTLYTGTAVAQVDFGDAFDRLDEALEETREDDSALEAEFEAYKQKREQEYLAYRKQWLEAYEDYRAEILEHWPEAEVTDRTRWVEYSDDMKTKRVVDFEQNQMRISLQDTKAREKDVKREVAELIGTTLKEARERDPVLVKLDATAPGTSPLEEQPMVAELFDTPRPDEAAIEKKAKELIAASTRSDSRGALAEPGAAKALVFTIPLPKNIIRRRAERFRDLVLAHANANKVEPALVFAVIHAESSFLPLSMSPPPAGAIGLMQVVPDSAGLDVTKRLEGSERMLSKEELQDPVTNVKVGTTFLNILYYGYLKGVEDPVSRTYCTIAAYNTGHGNVARAFTGERKMRPAFSKINRLEPTEVFNELVVALPYDETRRYLQRVVALRDLYQDF